MCVNQITFSSDLLVILSVNNPTQQQQQQQPFYFAKLNRKKLHYKLD